MEISFSKYSGCGNDFIMIDNRKSRVKIDADAIVNLCNRHQGIGADGVIFLGLSSQADFSMRIFNCDGSEAEMCGNGIRCLGEFILELGYSKKPYSIQTKERILTIDFNEDKVVADVGNLHSIAENFALEIEGQALNCFSLNTGVPHAVVFVEELDHVPVELLGAKIRHHPKFFPLGTNANFVERVSENKIRIRTFERGVESETLACGTGAAASAIAANLKWGMKAPIEVVFRSNDALEINFITDLKAITQITQTGHAVKLFHGVFDMRGYL